MIVEDIMLSCQTCGGDGFVDTDAGEAPCPECGDHWPLYGPRAQYHAREAVRIQAVLADVGDEYAEDGVVKTVLRARIDQEKRRAAIWSRRADATKRGE